MRRAIGFLSVIILLAPVAACAGAGPQIYDVSASPQKQIATAMDSAAKSGKNIVLVFGANWCPDCHALDAAMQKGDLADLIKKNYVVVKIDVGRFDKNLDVAEKYGVPIHRGIPALAVLDPQGKVLFAQSQGQFANAAQMPSQDFQAFFEKWKPKT
jgi:thioredoxin 1